MNKSKTNFLVDSLMFISMLCMIGIGFLMNYRLIPGSERVSVYGMNVDLSLWGMDRHDWGDIHLIIGFVLIGLLTLHIILHWKMILSLFQKLIKNNLLRLCIGIVFLLVSLFLIIAPFILSINVEELGAGSNLHHGNHSSIIESSDENSKDEFIDYVENEPSNSSQSSKIESYDENSEDEFFDYVEKDSINKHQIRQNKNSHNAHEQCETFYYGKREIEVKGYMTINEVSDKYDISENYLKKELNFPLSTSNNQRFGILKKVHGFVMHDIEKIISDYHKSKVDEK